jgi:F0F1-type ATP synthase assembly protein I|tara:strand:+ start:472 stop:702 length:231 start_codon:yes stop_codon:yes gene_type:complete
MPVKSTKKQLNKYVSLASIPFQIGSVVYVGSYFGKILDLKYGFVKTPWMTLVFVLFAIVLSFYSIIKQLQRINKNE